MNSINGVLLRKLIIAGANELNKNKQIVNSLNVFPVPDGDTGTNMSLTVLAAAREVEKLGSINIYEVAKSVANGALRGARGNSGVIMSQIFRGFSKGLVGVKEAGTKELAFAIREGVKTAYKAVMKPKEGTILTIARACAESAEKISNETDNIEVFLKQIIEDANEMLSKTTDMLPALKQANVVDAGGKGLIFILEGAFKGINYSSDIKLDEPLKTETPDFSALASVQNQSITFGYCTEFFVNIDKPSDTIVAGLKNFLTTIGDSIVCVSDDSIIKIHVHTNHPGLAIEKALTIGSLTDLKIDNMRQQHTNKIDFSSGTNKKDIQEVSKNIGFISISSGEGLTKIFKNLGVDEVIEGGQTMNPSTEDILNSISRINAKNIIILPNNKNIILAAKQAANLEKDKKVFVISTKTIPEGISAMLNYIKDNSIEENIENMKESILEIKTATLTYAVRDTIVDEKEIKENDILGMLNDKIVSVTKDIFEGAKEIIKKSIDDESSIISIYYGRDIKKEDAQRLVSYVDENFPNCEVELEYGGQPLYYYIISVE